MIKPPRSLFHQISQEPARCGTSRKCILLIHTQRFPHSCSGLDNSSRRGCCFLFAGVFQSSRVPPGLELGLEIGAPFCLASLAGLFPQLLALVFCLFGYVGAYCTFLSPVLGQKPAEHSRQGFIEVYLEAAAVPWG